MSPAPHLEIRVVRGRPDAAELAALTAVLLGMARVRGGSPAHEPTGSARATAPWVAHPSRNWPPPVLTSHGDVRRANVFSPPSP
ncbi:acyl-CoA carboxylase subunit epsilon [Streptomyces sp. 8N706]|uniref:acyl-CoA carboxylase subunit epsilon n=1 Tax=Streptomyces sp. 8N706 TaxID=3457416 RepID=UPI003FD682C5